MWFANEIYHAQVVYMMPQYLRNDQYQRKPEDVNGKLEKAVAK